ncbi:hypothetical protein [Hymenobacter ruricola]|uniref:Uncharacterized protein n=1 Tax=Hymenobacter ruricola TaxID=2791023 RepID=A0ABS0HZQ8_9BACT|nr:hypothetical protein [Hymenobacter ruricola]MBF9220179.1 hypothetical protein [Hymenobacter ruricola]
MKALFAPMIGLGLLLQGCAVTITGFNSGYKKLSPSEQEKIRFVAAGEAIPATGSGLVYAVNAQSLLNALPAHDSSLVYIWGPNCHGKSCASLQSLQDVCKRKGYRLYVVAEYYDMAQISLQAPLETPLLAVNQRFYKTDYCNKYTRLFSQELRNGQPLPDSVRYARYYLFKGKSFVKAANAVKDTQPQFPQLQQLGLHKAG